MDSNNTMEYRINLEKQNKSNDQVTELILDNCRASQISGLTDEFVNLEILSLINVGLVTLKGFPKLPKLKKLELSDNRLTGGLDLLHGSPNLHHLNISGNRIKDLEALEPLKEFQELVTLDLYNCEVTQADDYRKMVFDMLPNLLSLDGFDKNEIEVPDPENESEDEASDIENRIAREDGDDLDDEEDDDDDDDDEEGSSSEYDEEGYGQNIHQNYADDDDDEDGNEDDDDEDDDDDDDDEDEDDDDEEDEEEAERIRQAADRIASAAVPLGSSGKKVENGDNKDEGGEDDEDDDDDDDDEEAGELDSDLTQLQKDFGEGEDSDDDDFEPSHEPDARDYEIDPEDDADEDESSAHYETSTAFDPADSQRQKGTKRKHEDEGGDEVSD